MAEVVLHFLTKDGVDADAAAEELKADLSETDGIEEAYVETEQPRLGPAEILTILQCVSTAVDLLKAAAGWVNSHRKDVNAVEIEIDGRRVPIDQLTADQRAILEKHLAGTA